MLLALSGTRIPDDYALLYRKLLTALVYTWLKERVEELKRKLGPAVKMLHIDGHDTDRAADILLWAMEDAVQLLRCHLDKERATRQGTKVRPE